MTSSVACCKTMNSSLGAGCLTDKLQIGTLTHDRSAIRFAYDPTWLQHPLSFAIDPDLSLGEGVFHPKPDQGNFRVFDDSAPDRWGQMLMKRREALSAKDEHMFSISMNRTTVPALRQ